MGRKYAQIMHACLRIPTLPVGMGGAGRLRRKSVKSVQSSVELCPHRRKPQPVWPDVCADHRGHIDHQNITRNGLADFHHHTM